MIIQPQILYTLCASHITCHKNHSLHECSRNGTLILNWRLVNQEDFDINCGLKQFDNNSLNVKLQMTLAAAIESYQQHVHNPVNQMYVVISTPIHSQPSRLLCLNQSPFILPSKPLIKISYRIKNLHNLMPRPLADLKVRSCGLSIHQSRVLIKNDVCLHPATPTLRIARESCWFCFYLFPLSSTTVGRSKRVVQSKLLEVILSLSCDRVSWKQSDKPIKYVGQ